MATPSRMLLRSTSAALKLFNKSTPILTCASGGLAFPSATSRYIDQLAVSKLIIGQQQQQLSVVFRKEMLVARGRPTKVVDSEEDDDEDDEIEDGDYDDDDEIEDELEDAVDDEDEDDKKVRTRSDRDAW